MPTAQRIDVDEARDRTHEGDAVLVCAYDDEEKCRGMMLEGAITLDGLRDRLPELDQDRELIFYCD